ncbi:hypothetical protein PHYBOEH_011400 [Phytophthora boehmeriae]|uniref:Uncharacterized protein n=1 Tax=Phytophthora boehmeriae TaxID=109152 RepID=A0A8T1VK00_9STRA|nr:hypothetical protein PHYBOEH_011400 [Phytophthora boehmeriae]
MRLDTFLLLAVNCVMAVSTADSSGENDITSQYVHVPTSCKTESCVSGGCLFENCAQPLSCKGGLCYFRKCKEAVCEGGACIFDDTPDGTCPGGACEFRNAPSTLQDGYCDGGGCKLDGTDHPSSFSSSLAE